MPFTPLKILVVLLFTSCSEGRVLSTGGTDKTFDEIKRAQNYENFVEIKSVIELIPVTNWSNLKDTLVLYSAVTRFYADNWKSVKYLRLCFLSNPYQFYQTQIENGYFTYSIGKVDISKKSIQILRNEKPFKWVSEIHYTLME